MTEGEFGWNGVYNTVFWVDPVNKLAVVFGTQLLCTDKTFRRRLRTLVNAALDLTPEGTAAEAAAVADHGTGTGSGRDSHPVNPLVIGAAGVLLGAAVTHALMRR